MSVRMFLFVFLIYIKVTIMLPDKLGIDPDLKVYINKVKRISNNNLGNRAKHVNFKDLEKGVLGRCLYFNSEVQIDKDSWKTLSERGRILLMAHELTHCEKRIRHFNYLTVDGCNYHYMNSHADGNYCINKYFNQYVQQMRDI